MPLRLQVEPGGEFLVPFAKKKLLQWHKEMLQVGTKVLAREILVTNGIWIFFNCISLGSGEFLDRIRITTGGGTYYRRMAFPNMTPSRGLYIGAYVVGQWRAVLSDRTILDSGSLDLGDPMATYPNISDFYPTLAANPAYGDVQLDAYDVGTFESDWEIARWKRNSDIAINKLKVGILDDGTFGPMDQIKRSAIGSGFTSGSRVVPIAQAFTVTGNQDMPADGTQSYYTAPGADYDITATRTQTAQYTTDKGILRQVVTTGTWRQQAVRHIVANGAFVIVFTDTFSNFPDMANLGQQELMVTYPLAKRAATQGPYGWGQRQAHIINGVAKTVAFGYNIFTYGSIIADNTDFFGIIGDPTWVMDFVSDKTESNINVHTLPLYIEYLEQVRPIPYNSSMIMLFSDLSVLPTATHTMWWVPDTLADGVLIDIMPYSPVKDGVDLGIFGVTNIGWITDATHIKYHGVATFKYNLNGSFTFVRWREAQVYVPANPETGESEILAGPIIIPYVDSDGIQLPWSAFSNSLVRYRMLPWPGVKAFARTQAAQIKSGSVDAVYDEMGVKANQIMKLAISTLKI